MVIKRESLMKEIMEELKYLQDNGVRKLMQEKREDEIKELLNNGMAIGDLEFSAIWELCKVKGSQFKREDLLPEYAYEMILYFSKTEIKDKELFMDKQDMQELLRTLHEEIPTKIANQMELYNLCDFSIHNLLYGICQEQ